ncbi:MAG TPA: endonuclease/exonuclease/phosphatase family protein [Pirellulales bacterium]|jgi:endonuclease/exonuclease/phosphatase family metal-dependent hydrolase
MPENRASTCPAARATRLVSRRVFVAICLAALALATGGIPLHAAEGISLRVMSFNLWHGGDAGRQPLAQTLAVIRAAQADVVGLQETAGLERDGQRPDNAQRVAAMLGWHYHDQGDRTGVISRYPIAGATPREWGVQIELPDGRRVWLFNAHLAYTPYQPYQLLKIPYENAPFVDDAAGAVAAAEKARGGQVERLLAEVRAVAAQDVPLFITGDFNEPSVLDWTPAVARAGRCPVAVEWPSTRSVMAAGFVDAYRQLHADPLAAPGYTWTTTTAEDDPKDHHDRIDFVFVGGRKTHLKAAQIVGEKSDRADIVVAPYPSDHRGVVVTVALP